MWRSAPDDQVRVQARRAQLRQTATPIWKNVRGDQVRGPDSVRFLYHQTFDFFLLVFLKLVPADADDGAIILWTLYRLSKASLISFFVGIPDGGWTA
jgi:hypothetical protein